MAKFQPVSEYQYQQYICKEMLEYSYLYGTEQVVTKQTNQTDWLVCITTTDSHMATG